MTTSEDVAAIVASSGDAIIACALDGTITHWNPGAEQLYGYLAPEVVGRTVGDVLPADWAADVRRLLERVGDGDHINDYETSRRRKDGTSIPVSLTVRPIRAPGGEVAGASVLARDLSERKRAERMLTEQTKILEMVAAGEGLEATLDAIAGFIAEQAMASGCSILLLGEDGRTLRHGGGLRVTGLDQGGVEDLTDDAAVGPCGTAAMIMADLVADPAYGARFRELARQLGFRTCWSPPIVAPRSDRVIGTFALYYPDARQPGAADWELLERVTHLAALAVEHDRTMAKLAHQATHDPLTGAGNRTLVLDRLSRALAQRRRHGSSLALLYFDLDRFKALNDTHGHVTGDQVLVDLADRLHRILRREDTLARVGGDEFVILCEHLSGELEAIGVAERVAAAVGQPFRVDQRALVLTASIGIAFPRGADVTAEALLGQADAAMYQAKDQGKARWQVFDRAMHDQALSRLQTEHALRDALDQGQFRLHYQPMVELDSGRVVAAEALLRWEHPERGLLAPAAFLDVAEDSGLIVPIGHWALKETCRQATRWRAAGPEATPVTVHLNVSARQLSQPRFPDAVRGALATAGTDPNHLCLEITETAVMDNAPGAMRCVRALKALGVSLSIDDFGTGYSSLAYLTRFPIDELKVDRSFVAGLGRRNQESTIVLAVVSLARALRLRVVAEGVESADQVRRLRDMACARGQGYYWSRPVEPHQMMLR